MQDQPNPRKRKPLPFGYRPDLARKQAAKRRLAKSEKAIALDLDKRAAFRAELDKAVASSSVTVTVCPPGKRRL